VTGAGRGLADEEPFWKQRYWWRRTGTSTVAMLGATVATLVTTIVVARGLGPKEYGVLLLAVAITTLVAMLSDLTFDEAVVKLGYRELSEGRTDRLRSLVSTVAAIDVAIGVCIFLLILATAAPLAALAGGSVAPELVRLAALAGLAATLDGTTTGVLLIAGRPDLRAWAMAFTSCIRLAAVIIALTLGGAEAVLIAYAAAAAIGAAGQAWVAWRVAWRHWRRAPSAPRQGGWVRELLRFGIHTSVTTTVIGANRWLVPIVLGSFAGPSAVGIFGVAFIPVLAAAGATAPLRLNLYPEQVKLATESRFSQLERSIAWYTRIALGLGVPTCVVAWFAAPWLIPLLFSAGFDEALWPTRIMLVAALAQLAYGWAKSFPAAIGRPELRTRVSIIELLGTLLLLAVLSGEGALGAAAAVAIVSVALLIVWLGVAKRVLAAGAVDRAPPERLPAG
jgi:O-antigen/teichoic acid export membrane protein